jgi:hypothetical protein
MALAAFERNAAPSNERVNRLSAVYDRFTEGHEPDDLKAARQLPISIPSK